MSLQTRTYVANFTLGPLPQYSGLQSHLVRALKYLGGGGGGGEGNGAALLSMALRKHDTSFVTTKVC